MTEPRPHHPDLALLQEPGVRSAAQREYLHVLHELQVHQAEIELQNDALRRAQRELEDAHARYFELYELAPVGYATLDARGRVMVANLVLSELVGIERRRLVGSSFADYVVSGDRQRFAAFLKQALKRAPLKQSIELSLRNGAGTRPVLLEAGTNVTSEGASATKIEAAMLRVAVIDRTTVQRAEEQARDRERHLRAVFDTVADGILTVAPNGTIESCNAAAASVFRTSVGWLVGVPVHRLLPDVGKFVGQGRTEVRAECADGSAFPAEISVSLLAGPEASRLVVVVTDISERKERDSALEQALTRFRQIAEHIDDAFFVMDADTGRTLYVSPAFERISGRPLPKPGEKLLPLDWIHADDREKVAAAAAALREGVPFDLEYRLCRPDGSIRTVRGRASSIGEQHHITGILHDATDELLLQSELRQAQRLEAIGTLSSGIAHDFNNLLMGVGGCLQLALRRVEPENRAHSYLRRAVDAILRGANLTRQILRFSDTRSSAEEPVELDAVITGSRELVQSLIGEQIALVIVTQAPGLRIAADPGDIEQVLLNLASNARDAMPSGGTLTLRTEPLQGGRVLLSVGDVGIGMTEETRRRVFEPFYTTKEVGKGTGLGLSTVFAVVRRMGGTISISTALGKGTTFTLNLPVVIAEPALARDDSDDAAPGEGETVLIVDDDALIRMTVETYVESLGYRALTAANVPDALKIYMESTRPIDAVLTDIMMPGLLGSELGRILHTNAPEIAVIFMSAHPHRELVRKGHVHEDAHWLSKPFDAHELGVTLRHALKDRARSEPPQRLRIFAIDDDADVLEALRDLLELDGHSVGVATTTHDALRDVPRFVPDVVLCDVNLEEPSSGIDLVARLRRDEQLQKTIFLAVTGMAPNPIRPTAMAAGFEDVLTKPLDFQKLSRDLVSRVRR